MHNMNRQWRSGPMALAMAGAVLLAGCSDLLEVDNPNSVLQEDLEAAGSVNALVNGALSSTAVALSDAVLATMTFTDEYDWVGSWNAAGELNGGTVRNPENDFTNVPFNDLSEARWLSENAISVAETFREDLPQPADLARAYLYAGVTYLTIAESYEDFTFSDRTEPGPPIGPANMDTVFDLAIERFTQARTEAQSLGRADLALTALALRARAHFAKALWTKMQPAGSVPSDPLVNDAAAVADANAFFQEVTESDWVFRFNFGSQTITSRAASWANQRNEVVVGIAYGTPDASGLRLGAITLEDPISGEPDPALLEITSEFIAGIQYSPIRVVTARELRLILAEAALAAGNTGAAVDHLNEVRAAKGVADYDPAVHTSLTPLDMLRHERRVNLFQLNSRRMWDLYRFGETVEDWVPGAEAIIRPGSLFAIGREEQLSNCYILGTC